MVENLRGRGEKLDLLLQFGFTQNFSLIYNIPYIDRRQKTGLRLEASYAQNRSIAYQTRNHQLDFVRTQDVMRERIRAKFGVTRRNDFYTFHSFELNYQDEKVADTILQLNSQYFLNQNPNQRYLGFNYQFTRDFRDITAYPLRGSILRVGFRRKGLGIFNGLNTTLLEANYGYFHDLGSGFFLENQVRGQLSIQPRQPYSDAQAVGYGENLLRGYELYVIDGQSFILNNNTLRFRLFDIKKSYKFIPIRQFRTVPLASYLTAYFDNGFVKDEYFTELNRRFSNRWVQGWGVGLDFVTFYNLVFRFNYAVNSDLEGRFFFNFRTNI
ncbi:MAG: hypothetical protein HC880_15625 [Bacteroidia bacterium]|nr:hypothetical protein [Bacteroidia bacterium]